MDLAALLKKPMVDLTNPELRFIASNAIEEAHVESARRLLVLRFYASPKTRVMLGP